MTSIPPDTKSPPAPEPIGGLLALEAPDELALGAVDDYTDELALGEADEDDEDDDEGGGAMLSLSFGASTSISLAADDDTGTGAWDLDLSGLQELSVKEVKGDFGGDGDASRFDAMVMEDEFDPDAQVITAVWEGPQGDFKLGTQVRRARRKPQLMPYWILAAALSAAGLAAVLGIGLLIVIGLLTGPEREFVPLEEGDLPKVEIERKPIEEKTADEILDEVLGEDAD